MSEDFKETLKRIEVVRNAIIDSLAQRLKDKDATVKLCARSSSPYEEDDEHSPRDFVAGSGEIACPICGTGKVRYSRAAYNGHVHAGCTTQGCVRWME